MLLLFCYNDIFKVLLILSIFKSVKQTQFVTKQCCNDSIFKWHETKYKVLHIGGIFPMIGGWPGGQACLPSAIMALNEVNLNTNILSNYKLKLTWYNSEVS